jgi:hypothetical protein
VYDTEQWEVVYNIRVADFHTYFVGDETWGFALWAHNDYSAYKGYLLKQGEDGLTLKNGVKIHASSGGPFKPNTTRPAKPVLRDLFYEIVQPLIDQGTPPQQVPQVFVTRMRDVFGDNIGDDQIELAWRNAIKPASTDDRHENDYGTLGQAGEAAMVRILTGPGYNLKFMGTLQNQSGQGVDGVFLSQDGNTLYIVDAKASNGASFGMSKRQKDLGPKGFARQITKDAEKEQGSWANNPTTMWESEQSPGTLERISTVAAAAKLQTLLDSHQGRALVGLKVEVPCNNDTPIESKIRVRKGNTTQWALSVWAPAS